jgi:hypothetical protein
MAERPPKEEPPYVLRQHGMADLGPRRRRENLAENMLIARECEEAAAEIAATFPVAARLLMEEARRWR